MWGFGGGEGEEKREDLGVLILENALGFEVPADKTLVGQVEALTPAGEWVLHTRVRDMPSQVILFSLEYQALKFSMWMLDSADSLLESLNKAFFLAQPLEPDESIDDVPQLREAGRSPVGSSPSNAAWRWGPKDAEAMVESVVTLDRLKDIMGGKWMPFKLWVGMSEPGLVPCAFPGSGRTSSHGLKELAARFDRALMAGRQHRGTKLCVSFAKADESLIPKNKSSRQCMTCSEAQRPRVLHVPAEVFKSREMRACQYYDDIILSLHEDFDKNVGRSDRKLGAALQAALVAFGSQPNTMRHVCLGAWGGLTRLRKRRRLQTLRLLSTVVAQSSLSNGLLMASILRQWHSDCRALRSTHAAAVEATRQAEVQLHNERERFQDELEQERLRTDMALGSHGALEDERALFQKALLDERGRCEKELEAERRRCEEERRQDEDRSLEERASGDVELSALREQVQALQYDLRKSNDARRDEQDFLREVESRSAQEVAGLIEQVNVLNDELAITGQGQASGQQHYAKHRQLQRFQQGASEMARRFLEDSLGEVLQSCFYRWRGEAALSRELRLRELERSLCNEAYRWRGRRKRDIDYLMSSIGGMQELSGGTELLRLGFLGFRNSLDERSRERRLTLASSGGTAFMPQTSFMAQTAPDPMALDSGGLVLLESRKRRGKALESAALLWSIQEDRSFTHTVLLFWRRGAVEQAAIGFGQALEARMLERHVAETTELRAGLIDAEALARRAAQKAEAAEDAAERLATSVTAESIAAVAAEQHNGFYGGGGGSHRKHQQQLNGFEAAGDAEPNFASMLEAERQESERQCIELREQLTSVVRELGATREERDALLNNAKVQQQQRRGQEELETPASSLVGAPQAPRAHPLMQLAPSTPGPSIGSRRAVHAHSPSSPTPPITRVPLSAHQPIQGQHWPGIVSGTPGVSPGAAPLGDPRSSARGTSPIQTGRYQPESGRREVISPIRGR